jgi:hypothetical protein
VTGRGREKERESSSINEADRRIIYERLVIYFDG